MSLNFRGFDLNLLRVFDAVMAEGSLTRAADVLATRVRSCSFVYDPNQGATQQNGFVWMELELARNAEAAHLTMGAHVANGP